MKRTINLFALNIEHCNIRWSVLKSCIWITTAALLCVALIYRIQIWNGFSVLGGDRFDSVISASILEHWHRVFSGESWWSDAGYFYPYKNTIAQTDAYFLVAIPYHLLRLFHFDPLLAQELTGMLIHFFGFLAFYILCRKCMALSQSASIAGASLFVLMASSSVFLYRTQFSTLALAPLVTIMAWRSVRSLNVGNTRGYRLNGAIAAALFSLWCFTCFYLAWFFLYFCVIFLIFLAILRYNSVVIFIKNVVRRWPSTLLIVTIAAIFLIPFIDAFLPKSMEVGARTWDSVEKNLVMPWDLFLMHPSSVGGALANHMFAALFDIPKVSTEYARLGFSPLVLLCLIAVLLKREASCEYPQLSILWTMKAMVLSILFSAVSVVSFQGYSLWKYIYDFFPGASALNVASAIFIFLTFPLALTFAFYTDRLSLKGCAVLIWSLGFICLEVNQPYVNLNRLNELSLLKVPKAPDGCKAFYVGPLSEQRELDESKQWLMEVYPHNVAAVFIAQEIGIPTINGQASFNPPDWNFGYPARPDYETRISNYVDKHKLTDICRLDIEKKSWEHLLE